MSASSGRELLGLLNPKSIAVLGASSDRTKFSGRVLPYLLKHGYQGKVFPVNSRQTELSGIPCYPTLSSIPDQVECLVYCIGAAHIEATLQECEEKGGLRLIVVLSAGFAETDDDQGRRLQQALASFPARTGVRVMGPNCVGFVNNVDAVAVAAAAVLELPALPKGSVGVVSQSGGHAFGTLIWGGYEKRIGFSRVITTGNEADTNITDWADALVDDDATECIALTLEGVRNGPAFMAFLRRAEEAGKPVVILKSGQSPLGEVMAASHTGAIAGSASVFKALCKRHGATLVDDLDELYEIASMFAKLRKAKKLRSSPTPRSLGCAALSISGGHVGLFADLCSRHNIDFPTLDPGTQQKLAKELARPTPILNPVDLSGGSVSDPGLWGRCTQILLDDPAVDIVVPILTIAKNYDSVSEDIIRVSASTGKTVIVAWAGGAIEGQGKALLRDSLLPIFDGQGLAAKAIASLRACRRHTTETSIHPSANGPLQAARQDLFLLSQTLTVADEWESKKILSRLGFPTTREIFAVTEEEVFAAAERIGYPVVLKGIHPKAFHKSDAGLVRLDLSTRAEVEEALRELQLKMSSLDPGTAHTGILVQEMAAPGVELILGAKRDSIFGPVVMFGLGGIFVESLAGFALRLAPLTHADARSMIDETGGIGVLKGARGRRPADLDAIAALLVKLGDLAVASADLVREIEINPLVVADAGPGKMKVVDALIAFEHALKPVGVDQTSE